MTTKRSKSAFTLTEMLVVIVIIVLVLAMAMPVFHFITGSRSEEGAANQIAAFLGRVRSDAIGLQKPIGAGFFVDGTTGRTVMAEVEFANCPTFFPQLVCRKGDYVKVANTNPPPAPGVPVYPTFFYYIYTNNSNSTPATQKPSSASEQDLPGTWEWVGGAPIEIRPETDSESLPGGVMVQTLCDPGTQPGLQRASDNYLATGVIFFSSEGSLTTAPYGIASPTAGRLAHVLNLANGTRYPNKNTVAVGGNAHGILSQVGLVTFQREQFLGQGFTADDTICNQPAASYTAPFGSATQSEQAEEYWIDQNAQPLLINRFNGTIIRGD